jgi:predicted nucleotidyltransferase
VGLSLDTALQIAGYRASVFRDGLRSYMRTHSRANMLDLKSVFPHRKDGAIVLEECLDRGLFDRETPAITPAGEIIARAKVSARTPLTKARAVLDSFLERVENHENDPDAVTQVEEIWLFGSMLRGEETVGDIDLAMSTARKEMFRDNHDERYSHVEVMLQRYGKELATREDPWVMEERLTRFRLFGDRRHPLLSGVQTDFMDLASLGVPCRLIYDRKRGGRVDDPVLPRHPSSEGRSAEMAPPPRCPISPRRPSGRWTRGGSPHSAALARSYPITCIASSTTRCTQSFPGPRRVFSCSRTASTRKSSIGCLIAQNGQALMAAMLRSSSAQRRTGGPALF